MRVLTGLFLTAGLLCADVRLPSYERQILPNGVVLDVIPRREVPLVTLHVVLRGGTESDPADASGLAAVVAEALRRGTSTRSAEQFSQEIDALGATFQTSVNFQSTRITSELLSKDFAKGLDLMMDVLTRPAFPEAEIKKLLAQRIDGAKAIKDNPSFAANEYYRNLFFGPKHPYGRPADEATLTKITRDAIVEYHKKMYAGRNLIVVIAGDVDAKAASALVAKAFSSIPAGTAYPWKKADLPKANGARLGIIDKPDATETQFRIGMPGIDRTNPDRVPLWIVNTLFGGRFTSMLNDALRVNSGLTYGAHSRFDQDHLSGSITIETFTATANTIKAVDMALDVLKKVAKEGITAGQLASAKAYLKGTYPADRLETADQIADIVGDIELFDLNRSEVDDLFSRIDAVTLAKANEIAKKYLEPAHLTFLLLGNASGFATEAKKYAAEPVQVPITEPGLRIVR